MNKKAVLILGKCKMHKKAESCNAISTTPNDKTEKENLKN